ncbi:MAG: hypothetical protein IJP43_04800 [Oscillospiraceae bacterium]|nr:hypothetical protein [Oscillospiraceae bacterium]
MEIVGENEEGEYCSMTLTDEDGTATAVANERESVITFPDGFKLTKRARWRSLRSGEMTGPRSALRTVNLTRHGDKAGKR